jgi:hypothetical protein
MVVPITPTEEAYVVSPGIFTQSGYHYYVDRVNGITGLTTFATSRYERRLWVGLMEKTPQNAAGIRVEPPFQLI